MAAPDREAVARYAHAIDQSLGLDPHGQGESRAGGTRVAFPRPLSVRYLIDDATRTVTVIAIGWAGY